MAEAQASIWEDRRQRCHVLLPLPLGTAYDYSIPAEMAAGVGSFVRVPLGNRVVNGVIWGFGSADPENAVGDNRLRDITGCHPVAPMPDGTREFVDWVARYTCNDRGAVLRMAMSVPTALEAPKPRLAFELAGPPPDRMTKARGRVIDLLNERSPLTAAEISQEANVGASVVRGLIASGTLGEVYLSAETGYPKPDPERQHHPLSADQREIADALVKNMREIGHSVSLIDGVTGAGKTEVYFEAIAEALRGNQQVLVLLPEISLTLQWLGRFKDRFGEAPVLWHSEMKAAERRRNWRAVADGRARVVVGARSALFLPYCELGLIVVDEEHDRAFKQEDGVIYHARDMAVARAALAKFPIILASATPSLESLLNVERGRYLSYRLTERIGIAELPDIQAIDMRTAPPLRGEWLSPVLIDAVDRRLENQQQSLLFLNRRGYAPLTLCRTCGHRLECPHCSAWLVEHRFHGRLQCHHCGFSTRQPEACPECDSEGSLVACGPGVERLLEEVGVHWPDARAMVIASDTVYKPAMVAEAIRRIKDHEVDLIIGTQIIAKGHHFPQLTLVGVVDADLGLNGGDLRASELTFQLLSQVSGRAGRAELPGQAMLQTHMPDHPVMQAMISGDRDTFIAREQEARRVQGLPPFGRLVALIVSGPDEGAVVETANQLARVAPRQERIQVLGPAPAPLTLLRGRFRHRLLMKTARNVDASNIAHQWLAQVQVPNNVRVAVDVDPYSFL